MTTEAGDRLIFMRNLEAVTILVPESQAGSELSKTVTMDAPTLLALNETPVVLIPSPGNGQVVVVNRIIRVLRVNGTNGFVTDAVGPVEILNPLSTVLGTVFDEDVEHDADELLVLPNTGTTPFWGDQADFVGDTTIETAEPITMDQGAIVTSAKNAGGTGYAIGDLIYYEDAILRVLTLSTTAVGTYAVVSAGTRIATGTGFATTSSGAGTGFTLNVSAIDTEANATIVTVTAYYNLVNIL